MNIYEALKKLALKAVIAPDEAYEMRRIFRWYSRTFHTPLEEVEEIPIQKVLVHYFESEFENANEEQIEKFIRDMCESKEDKYKREMEEERLVVEDWLFLKSVEKTTKKPTNKENKLEDVVKATDRVTKAITSILKPRDKDATLPDDDTSLPPDVSISFSDDLDKDIEELDWSLFNKPKKPAK